MTLNSATRLRQLWSLTLQLTVRDVTGRYKGSYLGLLWAGLLPALMVGVYTLFFGVILKSKWHQDEVSQTHFALMVFCGLLVFNVFAESVGRAPTSITSNANYVTKVVFPIEVLNVVSVLSSLFHFIVGFAVLVVFAFLFGYSIGWTVVFLPLVLIPLLLAVLGVSWLLAALGVYLRDIGSIVAPALTALFFLSPVFYPATAVPERFRFLMTWNPLTPAIEQIRGIVMENTVPNFGALAFSFAVALAISIAGLYVFRRLKRGFADVL